MTGGKWKGITYFDHRVRNAALTGEKPKTERYFGQNRTIEGNSIRGLLISHLSLTKGNSPVKLGVLI